MPYGPIDLRLLAPFGDRLLITRADLPARHAWLVTGALVGSPLSPGTEAATGYAVPWHPGSADFLQGHPEPATDQ